MTYQASLDTINKVTTFAIIALMVVLGTSALYVTFTQSFPSEAQTGFPVVLVLIIAILIICYGLHPQSYSLTGETLTIHRPFGGATYALADITEVKQLPAGIWTGGGLRLFGVSGFFGYFGIFWSSKYGRYHAYGTRLDNKIFITFKDGRKILITPDSMELLDNLKRQTGK